MHHLLQVAMYSSSVVSPLHAHSAAPDHYYDQDTLTLVAQFNPRGEFGSQSTLFGTSRSATMNSVLAPGLFPTQLQVLVIIFKA